MRTLMLGIGVIVGIASAKILLIVGALAAVGAAVYFGIKVLGCYSKSNTTFWQCCRTNSKCQI